MEPAIIPKIPFGVFYPRSVQDIHSVNPLILRRLTRVYDLLQLVTEVIQCRIAENAILHIS